MKLFYDRKSFYLFILAFSIFSILFALYVEYFLQYKACRLCIYQRIPYVLAIFISFLGYNYYKEDKFLVLILIIFICSALISGYHFGIENNIFKEFYGCTTNTNEILDKSELLNTLNNMPSNCKDVTFKLLGFSLAGINLVLSLLIIVLTLRNLFYEKK